jgi:hypothetical protein
VTAPATSYRRHVRAVKAGAYVTLHVPWVPEAEAVAFDFEAPLLDRLLACAATGVMRVNVVEAGIANDEALRLEVLALALEPPPEPEAETPRDIVTLIIKIPEAGRTV